MHQVNYDLLRQMKAESSVVVINQHDESFTHTFEFNRFPVTWINCTERGLSKSRNMAIRNASADICVLADDDVEYVSNYRELIIDQFRLNPQYDIIAFQVEGIERPFKKYSDRSKRLGYLSSMKVSSVEIAFRLESIRKKGLRFNELFGSGTKYLAGEESIFLYECLKNGLKLKYVPLKIADIHIGNSTWFTGFNKEYFVAKGAIFTAMSQKWSLPLIFQFAIRKFSLYNYNMSIKQAVTYMLAGRKQYLAERRDPSSRDSN